MSFVANGKSGKAFTTSCEEAHTSSQKVGEGAFSVLRDKLELASLKGDTEAKAKMETLDQLKAYAESNYDKLKENGHNQNVRFTAKLIDKDNVGKDGTVYDKAGDLKMTMTINTGRDRKLIVPVVANEEGKLDAGFVYAEDKREIERIAETKDGKKFEVYKKLTLKDMSDRERDIVQLVTGKDFSKELTDFAKAYATKREQIDAFKEAGYAVYVAREKEPSGTYIDKATGEEKPSYKELVEYGTDVINGEQVECIQYTLHSPSPAKIEAGMKALPFSLEIAVAETGECTGVKKLEFTPLENGKFQRDESDITMSELAKIDPAIAKALSVVGEAPAKEEPMQSFGKSDVQTEQPHKSNFTEKW